jgi:hypothetical protein
VLEEDNPEMVIDLRISEFTDKAVSGKLLSKTTDKFFALTEVWQR